MEASKSAVMKDTVKGKVFSVIGYLFAAFFLLYILGSSETFFDNIVGTLIAGIFLFVPAVFFILKGIKIKRTIKRYKTYVSFISTQDIASVDRIATLTEQPVGFVRNDLQNMINNKYFSDAVIDLASDEIVIRSRSADITENFGYDTFKCPACGGSSKIKKGEPRICGYCGSAV